MITYLRNFIICILFPTSKGVNFNISGALYRRGRGRLVVGNNVKINSSKKSNFLGGKDYTTIFIDKEKEILIGDNVGISNATLIAFERIAIEDNVMIGADVKIYDTDFHSLNFGKRMNKPEKDIKTLPIHIKEGAFIGAHSIILKGVTIGKKSIVGAGSVVAKSIPDGEVWAGNPAKFIKKVL